ncbi:MAG: PPC domain-containing protein [Gemmataceae bacterium]|nr:PPC domain-containing protein [Gemmataceae bacterium]
MPRLVHLVTLSLCHLVTEAQAQLPHARLDRLFPLGGSPGKTLSVSLEGRDLDGVAALRFDRPGFKAAKEKGGSFSVSIPADAAPGTVEVRAVGPHGLTAPRLFAIGRGLADVPEKEPNDTAETAQRVPLECAVHGRSDGEGEDWFRFAAKKGQRLSIDCQALRLDSTLRASLVLSDASGKELMRSRPHFHRTDPFLDFAPPADGDYLLRLHDATYAGGLPYRLMISTKPHVEAVFPPVVEPGAKTKLSLVGQNLPSPAVEFTGKASPLLRTLWHPPAASVKARGEQFYPWEDALSPAMVLHADHPVIEETEPGKEQTVKLPCWIAGRLPKPGSIGRFAFDLEAGEQVAVEAWGERLERPGDLFLVVTDDKGAELAAPDDHGISRNALALYNRDPMGSFTAPRKGTYRVQVQDRYNQGGPRHVYALRLAKPAPDFYPVAFHSTNPHPTCPLVRAGGSDWLEVCLNRRHFTGPVVIEAKGLPPGVGCPPVHVSAQTENAVVVFTAAEGAKDWEGAITLTATAGKLVREVACVQRRWAIDNISTSRVCREIGLAVRQGAPYGLALPSEAKAKQGTTAELKAKVRRSAGFAGKVQVTGLELPPGFSLPAAEIPEGKDEATLKLAVAANVPAGTYSLAVRGDAQVRQGTKVVRVADPSSPVLLTVEAAKK